MHPSVAASLRRWPRQPAQAAPTSLGLPLPSQPLLAQCRLCCAGVLAIASWIACLISWFSMRLMVAVFCGLAMCFQLRFVTCNPLVISAIATGIALVACLWAGWCHSKRRMPAAALLLQALVQLYSSGVSVQRQLVLLGTLPALLAAVLIVAHLLPPAISGKLQLPSQIWFAPRALASLLPRLQLASMPALASVLPNHVHMVYKYLC